MIKNLNSIVHKLYLLYKTGKSGGSIWNNSVAQYSTGSKPIYWESLTEVAKYQFEQITGNPDIHYMDYIIEKIKKTYGRDLKGLSIGSCEANATEQIFYQTGMFSLFDIMDIADELLEKQRKRFNNDCFNYIRTDFNTVNLPENRYDLIAAIGTIHHVKNLDNLFENINGALTDTGLFFCREYVGPNFLQFKKRQLRMANGLLECLPDSHKKTPDNRLKRIASRPNLFKLKIIDPSEAVHSEEIEGAMKRHLDIIEYTPTGGTLLSPVLDQIAFNFEANKTGTRLLASMITIERELIQSGEIGSDYMFAIGKKKKGVKAIGVK